MKRISLEKRLGAARQGGIPRTAWLYLESYFLCLSRTSGDLSHKDYYKKILWDKQHPYGDVYNTFVAEAVAKSLTGAYPAEKGKELLYQILVKPFCNEKIGGKK